MTDDVPELTTLEERHPDYREKQELWETSRDAYQGEHEVKGKDEKYLPRPTGFSSLPGDLGTTAYTAYKIRARFPEIVGLTATRFSGLMHRKPSQYELPPLLQHLMDQATPDGFTLEGLHMHITTELMITGRFGLLPDLPVGGGTPYLVGYEAERIVNWGERAGQVRFVVLDETDDDFDEQTLAWDQKTKSRTLRFENGAYTVDVEENGVSTGKITPTRVGGGTLDAIPFVFVNATGLTPDPGVIPLLGLANTALSIYRLDADYRHQLYNSGQEFAVFIGLNQEDLPGVIGAGVNVAIPLGGDAKVIGPDGKGIDAHRTAIRDEYDNAVTQGAQLLQEVRDAESGDALRLRMSAQTATLTTIAKTAAQGMERALRNLARWVGADPEQVRVIPNLDFVEAGIDADHLRALVESWIKGAISGPTLHENLRRHEVVDPESTFESERALIEQVERALGPAAPTVMKADASIITALVSGFDHGVVPPETIIRYFRAHRLVPEDMSDEDLLRRAVGTMTLPDDTDLEADLGDEDGDTA